MADDHHPNENASNGPANQPPEPLQPLLNDAAVVLSAPTQVWSDAAGEIVGEIGGSSIHGIYHSDTRLLSELRLTVGGTTPEHIATLPNGPSTTTFVCLLRALDDRGADPRVRLERTRTVTDGSVHETLTIDSALDAELATSIELVATSDFSSMHAVKAGMSQPDASLITTVDDAEMTLAAGAISAAISADGARIASESGNRTRVTWDVTVPARGRVSVAWRIVVNDPSAVVRGVVAPSQWAGVRVRSGDSRLQRWVGSALGDLDALRLRVVREADSTAAGEPFLAAGAPWFFTLFGRDSIWAARFMLPLGTELAASTLRALAEMQGTRSVDATAEQPGKIMHELRPSTLTIPGENVSLPPLYYGTVDATPLWICLLHDAWTWGMPEQEVAALVPNLEAALAWMRDFGDSDGDGFLEYIDTTGHGLANQGWKDSGDSIQWRDGRIADGPIALCEVQGYAYEAAIGGAELLEHFGRDGADAWRDWAARLKKRFADAFWVDAPVAADGTGPYPAVALDASKRRVDTVTSNIGHLLGSGILDADEARLVAARLAAPSLNSGYGLRTMSTDSAGYWPLSYHGGSVWAHDTAIAIAGLGREGFTAEASSLIEGLLAAAEGFDYRMPELHSGDSAPGHGAAGGAAPGAIGAPVPYPAACRPQAWSAAAAVSVLGAALGLRPNAAAGTLAVTPISPAPAGAVTVDGIRFANRTISLSTDSAGAVIRNTLAAPPPPSP